LLWNAPPNEWQLTQADAHVWAASLDLSAKVTSALERTLSSDEKERARRFHFEDDRRRFIAARGTLRAILSSYLDIQAERLQFTCSSSGKPSLVLCDNRSLHFNLTHSKDLMLVAVTKVCAIGVDVEWIHFLDDMHKVAALFASSAEMERLMAGPEKSRSLEFFNLLTRKEAYLKATGMGLSDQVREIEVTFSPDEPAGLLALSGDSAAAAHWSLVELIPAAEFTGAVAAEARDLRLSCWRWSCEDAPKSR
jgi:4'-phosphopantetheinyl transferase